MANTKVLLVKGSDYSAKDYEDTIKDGKILPEELWEESYEAQVPMWYDDNRFQYEAFKFGDVDPDFVTFIQEHINYTDRAEATNFYII